MSKYQTCYNSGTKLLMKNDRDGQTWASTIKEDDQMKIIHV